MHACGSASPTLVLHDTLQVRLLYSIHMLPHVAMPNDAFVPMLVHAAASADIAPITLTAIAASAAAASGSQAWQKQAETGAATFATPGAADPT